MSDEQLQALFAGMEHHLDKRADATDQRVAAAEERILADVKDRVQALETKLWSEFWKWARALRHECACSMRSTRLHSNAQR